MDIFVCTYIYKYVYIHILVTSTYIHNIYINIYHLSIYTFFHGHDVGVRDGIGVYTQLTIHTNIYLKSSQDLS